MTYNNITQDITETDVQNAFEQDQFSVVYQAQVSLKNDNNFVGTEAFVRLNHPVYGPMVPATFLEIVRSSGRMMELTHIVLKQIAQDWASWKQQGFDLNVSVNIDSSILSEPDLVIEFGKVLSEFNIPKHQLTLEFSNCLGEGFLTEDVEKRLMGLRLKGYDLSIDDYGLGVISDNTINDLPFDEIKIDRKIVQNLMAHEDSQSIVRDAMRQASRYSMRVVAVGVETQGEVDWLVRNGCDRAQGYFFGKPIDANTLAKQCLNLKSIEINPQKRICILIIEDDLQYQGLLLESLSEHYDAHIASTLLQAGELIKELQPEIVIADVNLPDGSSIDFCKSEANSDIMQAASTIFISGGRDFKNKLDAYEAGGIDYMEKPFSIVELVSKIKQAASYQKRRQKLVSDVDAAQNMAMDSLKDAAYFGEIVQFYKNLFLCWDEEQLSREFFRFMAQKSLNTSVEFRSEDGCSNFDQLNGVCSAIEINLFEILQKKGRLYEFGRRMIVNDNHVSVLIKNMPENEIEQGKIRDYIAVIIEGMEARYRDVLRQRVLNSVTQQLQALAHKLLESVNEDQQEKNEIMERFTFDLKMSFHTLDLTDPQEQHITELINEMVMSKDEADHTTSNLGAEVNNILESMTKSLADFDDEAQKSSNDSIGDTVELF